MNSISPFLLIHASMALAMQAVDSGVGEYTFGPERVVTDFAVLSGGTFDDLPVNITICSSVTSGKAFTGTISPFQLTHQNGDSWIYLGFYAVSKNITHHHMLLYVSSSHVIIKGRRRNKHIFYDQTDHKNYGHSFLFFTVHLYRLMESAF